MPYFQAYKLLENPNCSVSELANSIEEMGMEYGYIIAMAGQGLREDSETDLVRILILLKALKLKIQEKL